MNCPLLQYTKRLRGGNVPAYLWYQWSYLSICVTIKLIQHFHNLFLWKTPVRQTFASGLPDCLTRSTNIKQLTEAAGRTGRQGKYEIYLQATISLCLWKNANQLQLAGHCADWVTGPIHQFNIILSSIKHIYYSTIKKQTQIHLVVYLLHILFVIVTGVLVNFLNCISVIKQVN